MQSWIATIWQVKKGFEEFTLHGIIGMALGSKFQLNFLMIFPTLDLKLGA